MTAKVRHISNVLVLLFLLWLVNFGWAKWGGEPILYCTFTNASFVSEIKGFYSLGLIALAIATAVTLAKRPVDGVSMIFITLLYAGTPVFFKTLFNVGGTCLN